MDSRISLINTTQTQPRQTPRTEFGAVLARTLSTATQLVGATVGGGVPVLSAALSAASRVADVAAATGGTAAAAGTTGKGEGWDLLDAQKAMQEQGRSFNMQYLALQEKLQKESREYTTVSNIMKVRHDSAKGAISNIR